METAIDNELKIDSVGPMLYWRVDEREGRRDWTNLVFLDEKGKEIVIDDQLLDNWISKITVEDLEQVLHKRFVSRDGDVERANEIIKKTAQRLRNELVKGIRQNKPRRYVVLSFEKNIYGYGTISGSMLIAKNISEAREIATQKFGKYNAVFLLDDMLDELRRLSTENESQDMKLR